MSNVLLIWEDVTICTRVFLLDDVSDQEMEILRGASGNFIHVSSNDSDTKRVLTRITLPEHAWEGMLDKESIGQWLDKEILNVPTGYSDEDPSAPQTLADMVHLVVVTGMYS